jgi:hypothetical protein
LIAYTVPQDGDYYLVVVHKDPAASSGTYKINYLIAAASSSGADDHENDAQHATPIAVGTPTHGICEIWGDQDWFRVTLVSGRTYDVAALGVTTSDDPAIWLYDSAQTLLAVDDDSGSAYPGGSSLSALVAGFVAPADGDYFIRVSGPYPTAQPEYHVVVEPR